MTTNVIGDDENIYEVSMEHGNMTNQIEVDFAMAEAHLNDADSKGLGRCKHCKNYITARCYYPKCSVEDSPYKSRMDLGQYYFEKGYLMDHIEALTMEEYPCTKFEKR